MSTAQTRKVLSHGELRALNLDLICLDIGKLPNNSLKESSLVVDTQDKMVLKTTKAIAKAIKKVAQAGVGYTSSGEESLGGGEIIVTPKGPDICMLMESKCFPLLVRLSMF